MRAALRSASPTAGRKASCKGNSNLSFNKDTYLFAGKKGAAAAKLHSQDSSDAGVCREREKEHVNVTNVTSNSTATNVLAEKGQQNRNPQSS